jgi:sugar-specific transcriptional regulator TrmB
MEDLGLTSYEIRVYVSLLGSGSMTAADISKRSGVPYSKIYEVLNSLEDKGWLESDSSRPQNFYPKSPSTALEATRTMYDNRFRESQSSIISELMPIYTKSGAKERPEIWVTTGIMNIATKVNEIIQSSQRELLVALPFAAESVTRPLLPVLRVLSDKGVRVNILASSKMHPETLKSLSRVAAVRVKDGLFGGGVIGDGKQVVILLSEGSSDGGKVEPVAIWAEHPGLAVFARGYFQYLWADSLQDFKKKSK